MEIRCFIAIDLPGSLRRDIGDVIESFKKKNADVKWVKPDNIHITLKFLGKTQESLLTKINDSLTDTALSYEPFHINIFSAGVFPNKRRPRIIWIGMEHIHILQRLREDVENSMTTFNYPKENRDFSPHITIGRVRSLRDVKYLLEELDNFQEKGFGMVRVDNLKLMRSELKPTGAQYYEIAEIPLGSKITAHAEDIL